MLGIRGVSPAHVARTGRRDRAERGDWLFRALQFRQLIVKPRARVTDLVAMRKNRRARDLATQLQALTGQRIVIRDGKAIITDNAA